MRVIYHLILKEFRQVLRQREMRLILFVMPMVQMFLFSFAVSTDLKEVRLAVLDLSQSDASRRLTETFLNSGYFVLAGHISTPAELEAVLLSGRADAALSIPVSFAERLVSSGGASVGLIVDGSNSSTAARVRGYGEALIGQAAAAESAAMRLKGRSPAAQFHLIQPEIRYFYNPELESRFYMIPGIVALIVTVVSAFLTGMAVVREKEAGTYEQLMVTPITPFQFIVGKTVPFFVLSYVELAAVTALAIFTFNLLLTGSVWLLALAAFFYLLTTLGVGLLVSTVSNTQQEAMFTLWFFLVFGVLMSGFFFPVENMPVWIERLTYLNPLRYFISLLRGLFLKGLVLSDLAPDLLGLIAIGVLTFSAAALRFRKMAA